jgi:2-dehydro-3-deoxyphosphogalactonate aldolase
MPEGTQLFAVGGAGPDNFAAYLSAGASGFGIGSRLFKPGWTPGQAGAAAREVVTAFDAAAQAQPG